jgi:hypothetical protein
LARNSELHRCQALYLIGLSTIIINHFLSYRTNITNQLIIFFSRNKSTPTTSGWYQTRGKATKRVTKVEERCCDIKYGRKKKAETLHVYTKKRAPSNSPGSESLFADTRAKVHTRMLALSN